MKFYREYPPVYVPVKPTPPTQVYEYEKRKVLETIDFDSLGGKTLQEVLQILQKYQSFENVTIDLSYDYDHTCFDIVQFIREEKRNANYEKQLKLYEKQLKQWELEAAKVTETINQWKLWKKNEDEKDLQQKIKEARKFLALHDKRNDGGDNCGK